MSRGKRTVRIFTVGHSDRSSDRFIGLLKESGIQVVADVRSNPASGRFPHFERHALAEALDRSGIAYRWFRSLGGLRKEAPDDDLHSALPTALRAYATAMSAPEFSEGVEELVGLAASTPTAVLCAERDPKQCHRHLLADNLTLLGVRVVHILDAGSAVPHELHPDLVVENGAPVYRTKQLPLL